MAETQSVITKVGYKPNSTSSDLTNFELGVPFKNVFLKENDLSNGGVSQEFTLKELYDFLEDFFKTSPFTAWTWSTNETMDYGPTDSRIRTWFQVS